MQTKYRDAALASTDGFVLNVRPDSSTFDPLADVDSPSIFDVVAVARGDVWEVTLDYGAGREDVVGAGLIGFGYAMQVAARELAAVAAASTRPGAPS